MKIYEPFDKPITIANPTLPDLKCLMEKFEEVNSSGQLTNFGEQHNKLENELKTYLESQYLSLFNNGTTALMIALNAMNLSGEVITTPFTFPATTSALIWNNLKPVFCDIEESSFNIDAEKIESLITPKTTAILPVHIFGSPCKVDKIQQIATKYNLKVIYDAAQAFGVKYRGNHLCNYGDISMISFHATKIFNTIEGACLTCVESEISEKIQLLRNFGINSNEVLLPGINGKMNEMQSIVGLLNLKEVQNEIAKRKLLDNTYRNLLQNNDKIMIKEIPLETELNYQYFVIRIKNRDYVQKELEKFNIFAKKYFYPLCCNYNYLQHLNSGNLDIAKKVSEEVLTLPLHGRLSIEDIKKICFILNSIID